MNNPFKVGQHVICDSDDFPIVAQHSTDKEEPDNVVKPTKGDVYLIDDILGEYITIAELNTNDTNNWWKFDRFRKMTWEETEAFFIYFNRID